MIVDEDCGGFAWPRRRSAEPVGRLEDHAMMNGSRTCMLVLGIAANLSAQDSAEIHGTVINRATGLPVSEVYVWVFPAGPRGWAVTDSLGRFLIRPVAPGERRVVVECPRPTGVWADTIAIAVRAGLNTSIQGLVETSRCAKPPRSTRTAFFTGLYETGFEAFGFLPDPDSTGRPVLWGRWPSTVVTFLPSARAREYPWPNAQTSKGYSCYDVRLHGTLEGPLTGEGIISIGGEYEFRVDSIVSIVAAAPRRCPSG